MNRILCGGIMIGLVLVARPAMASADLGVGTEVGAGWSEQRVDKVSRDEVMRPIGTTRAPNKAVEYLRDLAKVHATGYWSQCLKLADDAYMPKGPRLGTAFDQWYRAKKAGLAHPKDRNP
ncbi:MAG TPA: hypothetical protein PK635_14720, partial [Actinomycetota bacterium]|nr:hypothetical protein [Actinomycetota bacterium]